MGHGHYLVLKVVEVEGGVPQLWNSEKKGIKVAI